jgi:D-alanyl-D-alanine carboxypeptidase/D-alanyl-D-alanine-endopeptidase (penicillin-binding protein 4)
VDAILKKHRAERGYWGILVASAKDGRTLYARNPNQLFALASNTKLFTAVAATHFLGLEYRFRTTVESSVAADAEGRLASDLILVGRGDPNLSGRAFPYGVKTERPFPPTYVLEQIADQLVAKGLKKVEGDVVADDSYFVYDPYPVRWRWGDLTWGYGAPVSALAVNDNVVFLETLPGEKVGDAILWRFEPPTDFYEVVNRAKTASAGADVKLILDRQPGSRVVKLWGRIALGTPPRGVALGVEEPALYAASLFRQVLQAKGVEVSGKLRARHYERPEAEPGEAASSGREVSPEPAPASAAGESRYVLAEHVSLPLLELLRVMLKVSQNLHAEMLLRTIAREKRGVGTLEAGLEVEQEFLTQTVGLDPDEFRLEDGSGLSESNLATPRAVVQLLTFLARQPYAAALRGAMPVAGEDGTLSDRMVNTAAAGKIQAKTGTLGSINTLSGYATPEGGEELIFSLLGNAHTLKNRAASDVVDELAAAMVESFSKPRKTRR